MLPPFFHWEGQGMGITSEEVMTCVFLGFYAGGLIIGLLTVLIWALRFADR